MNTQETHEPMSVSEWYNEQFRPVGKGYQCKRCQSTVRAFREFCYTETGIRTTGKVIVLESCDSRYREIYQMHHPVCNKNKKVNGE